MPKDTEDGQAPYFQGSEDPCPPPTPPPHWADHGEFEIDKIEDVWALVLPIYRSGLNVMFQHSVKVDEKATKGRKAKDAPKDPELKGEEVLVWVDNSRFGQR